MFKDKKHFYAYVQFFYLFEVLLMRFMKFWFSLVIFIRKRILYLIC